MASNIFPHALEDVVLIVEYMPLQNKQSNKQNQDDCKHNQRNEFL